MPKPNITEAVHGAIGAHRLLDHRYYRSWQEGSLSPGDLREYAAQYRHFEAVLPETLAAAAAAIADPTARSLTEGNLHDELSSPAAHLDLFAGFCEALDADPRTEATPATASLAALYERAGREGPIPALSVIAAYEVQAAEIAATKAGSLRRHYGLSADATAFWDVHAEMEREHASWTTDALQALGADPVAVQSWAGRSSAAWWEFLDERETARSEPARI